MTTTTRDATRTPLAWSLPVGRVARRPAVALGLLITASAVIRSAFAVRHSVPHYFPDEYIYAALGRALAHGNLQIRGETSHFPGILEPVLAAPIWRFFSTTTAYHLVQVENAVIASFAAVPVYLLARWLRLSRRYAFFCAVLSLSLPELVLAGNILSDTVAYPLILTSVLVGVKSIDQPSTRRQLAFLALTTLSVLARVEYAVVVAAYLVAAIMIERRSALRKHQVAFGAVLPALAIVVVGVRGYYLGTLNLHFSSLAHWFTLQAFLLTVATGAVIVPGAVAALLRPNGRREAVYSAFMIPFALLVLAAASQLAVNTTRFKERYLFALVPLLAVAFGVYLRRRPLRPLVLGLAAVVAIALAQLPLSSYTAADYKDDSTLLMGTWNLQLRVGASSASLYVAIAATLGCLCAAAVALRKVDRAALAFALSFLLVGSIFATAEDLRATRVIRDVLPSNLTWVDDATQGPVTAIATYRSVPFELRETLFWNPSIQRELVLPGALASDWLKTPQLGLGAGGLLNGVRGAVLFDESGAVASLADADKVTGYAPFLLWRPHGKPRLRLLINHRYIVGWLGNGGRIQAWPSGRNRAVDVSFTVSLPRRWKRARLHFSGATVVLAPGSSRRVSCRSRVGALDIPYSSRDGVLYFLQTTPDLIIARLTNISVKDVPPVRGTGSSCVTAR